VKTTQQRTKLVALKLLPCLTFGLLVSGCSSTDISNRDPFYDYVGKTVELRRPVIVTSRSSSLWSSKGIRSRHRAAYGLAENEYPPEIGRIYGELPAGHGIRIDRVVDEVVIDGEQIVAYGHTTIPPRTNEVSFVYIWGFLWKLHPAPWEPKETALERGPAGELPAHFNYEMFKSSTDIPRWGTRVKGTP